MIPGSQRSSVAVTAHRPDGSVARALAAAQPWWSGASHVRLRPPPNPAEYVDLAIEEPSVVRKAISARANWLGGIDERLAASSFVFAYTQTLIAPAVATLVTAGFVPDMAASNARLAFPKPGHGILWLRTGAATTTQPERVTGLETALVSSRQELIRRMIEQAVDQHLSPLVDLVASEYRFSGRILRANVAYECCWAFRPFASDARFCERAVLDVHAFQALAARLGDIGEVVTTNGQGEIEIRFERRNCCLARLIPGKTTCDGCSLTRKRRRRGLP